jgi:hypothetical protein
MKKLLLVLCLVFSGCNGQPAPDSVSVETTAPQATAPVQAPQATFKTAVITAADGSIAAYVVGFEDQGRADVYIPSADVYAKVNLKTGTYVVSYVYYSGMNCTGTGYSFNWVGEAGKSIVFDGNGYFMVASALAGGGVISQSYCSGSVLSNFGSGPLGTSATSLGVLVSTTQPYDFTALAPIHVVYQ